MCLHCTGCLALPADDLLPSLADSVGVFYNYSQDAECFQWQQGANPETEEDGLFWGWQYCTEQTMPMSRNGGESCTCTVA